MTFYVRLHSDEYSDHRWSRIHVRLLEYTSASSKCSTKRNNFNSGSHVVLLLVKKYPQFKIVNFDRLDCKLHLLIIIDDSFFLPSADCSCIENLDEIKDYPNYKFVKGNICSSDLVNFVLKEEKIDTIMHFAAQTHVDNSFGNSFQFTQNNIMGTHVLLESAKVVGIKRFIHVSTDEVYGEQRLDQEAMSEEQVRIYLGFI